VFQKCWVISAGRCVSLHRTLNVFLRAVKTAVARLPLEAAIGAPAQAQEAA